jgi:hypothetical protein
MTMASDVQSARDDLAYLRGLVGGTGAMQKTIGEAFLWAGVLYGGQCIMNWLQTLGVLPSAGLVALAIGLGPTIVFCCVLGWIIWRERKTKATGVASRALGAVFQGAGLANLVMALVFAYGASKAEGFGLWLYHPIVVCMFQGVAWFVAWTILRRAWLGLVAAGWFAMTVALGVAVFEDIGTYLLILGVGLFGLMALPGYIMWRGAKQAG